VGTGETRLRPSSETAREADRAGGLGATNPISGQPDEMGESGAGVGGGHSSDEGVDNRTRRSKGPPAECAAQRRGSGIAEGLFTRRTTSRRDGCWDAGPTPVAGRNAARRLLGASRVRENRMHGSERERAGDGAAAVMAHGHRASPLLYIAAAESGRGLANLQESNGFFLVWRPGMHSCPQFERLGHLTKGDKPASLALVHVEVAKGRESRTARGANSFENCVWFGGVT